MVYNFNKFFFNKKKSIEDNVEYLNQISEDNDSQDDLIKENIILLRKNSV